MKTIQDFTQKTFIQGEVWLCRPQIVCNDGFTMSVQGSRGHYCSPRKDQDWYAEMEIGFPSKEEELIMDYAEFPETPTETVYGYVPIDVIQKVIDKHNGIDILKTLNSSK